MANTPTKLRYPTGTDDFQPHTDMRRLAESATTIVPVANRGEADDIVSTFNPSPEKPLFVRRADNGQLEEHDGQGWVAYQRTGLDGMVQKGRVTLGDGMQPNDTVNTQVTFNPPLRSVPDVLVTPSGSNRLIFRVISGSVSLNGFTVQARNVSSGGTSDGSFNWFAFV